MIDTRLNSLRAGYGGLNSLRVGRDGYRDNSAYSPYANYSSYAAINRSHDHSLEIEEKVNEFKKIIAECKAECKRDHEVIPKQNDPKYKGKVLEIVEEIDNDHFDYKKYILSKEDKHYKTLGLSNKSTNEEIHNKFNDLMESMKVDGYDIETDEKIFKILDAYLYFTKEKKFWM